MRKLWQAAAKRKSLSLSQRNEMEILVNPQNEQEVKVLLAFLDSLQYNYKPAYDFVKPQTVEEYNKEIDAAVANVKAGSFTTQDDLEKEMQSW